MSTTQRTFLGAGDVAKRLGISKRGAYLFIRDRTIPVVRVRGRDRVPAEALEVWIAEREREALAAVRGDA
jgi:excisionase family DNA binding protein